MGNGKTGNGSKQKAPDLQSSSAETQASEYGYWRSLNELTQTPEFQEALAREFAVGGAELPADFSRRHFLQIMGASLALAGAAGCRWEKEEITTHNKRPEGYVPGKPKQYATAMELGGVATGLLVTSYDGRPIKVEGNPDHPYSKGATDHYAQAAILEMYDPDRSKEIIRRENKNDKEHVAKWSEFATAAASAFAGNGNANGSGVRVLSEATRSPTVLDLRRRLLAKLPEAKWVEYESVSRDNISEGARQSFGRAYRPHLALDQARVIVALDEDLFAAHPARVRYARDFAARRKPEADWMSRLYAVESAYSLTGAQADHRLRLRAEQILPFLIALEERVCKNLGIRAADPSIAELKVKGSFLEQDNVKDFLDAVAEDLVENQGQSVLVAGARQPAAVHARVNWLNDALGNVGKTVDYTAESERPSHAEAIKSLVDEMKGGDVSTLLILGGNPVFDAPADLDFADALAKVTTSIHLGLHKNETARACAWHLPRTHFLESWGDARAYDGAITICQPLIDKPLYGDCKSPVELLGELLALIGGGDEVTDPQALVQRTFEGGPLPLSPGALKRWRQALHDGIVAGSAFPRETPQPVAQLPEVDVPPRSFLKNLQQSELEIVFAPDPSVYDGRFANNGWLQEWPDPITKVTWDNVALISPATAKDLNIKNETLIEITVGGRKVKIAAWVAPGHANDSVTVFFGQGRTAAGSVGGDDAPDVDVAPVGFNVYPLRSIASGDIAAGGVTPLFKRYPLASTQDHHVIDTVGMKGRAERLPSLIRETNLDDYKKHPDFAKHVVHHPAELSLFSPHSYDGHKWGMTIDLNKCTGCSACVVACQSENNIPVVGKQRVSEGREMQWLRIDRYFQGDVDDPKMIGQPLMCHHCENAPCEEVCPVGATTHTTEGLNDMIYNRCIGTRYCSNNCPYKVRRFNFFNYQKHLKDRALRDKPENETLKLAFNPEVTIRSRGVMEKCTWCVQRIAGARIEARNDGNRRIRDGEIKTACQQACPTEAIVFGDLNGRNIDDTGPSEVAILQALPRAYGMLAELNVKPRLLFLARVRNPHPKLKLKDEKHGTGSNHHG